MSNDVVISKIQLEKAVGRLEFLAAKCEHERLFAMQFAIVQEIKSLRVAPETVSLEGVETMKLYQWLNSQESGETELARVSDLRRLVSPVQHGAVVKMDFPHVAAIIQEIFPRATAKQKSQVFDRFLDEFKTQLPQPVAPVQSGGVDLNEVVSAIDFVLQKDAQEGYWLFPESVRCLIYARDALNAHLTTTQIAPGAEGDGRSRP